MPAALKQFDRAFHAFLHYGVPETLEAMDASVQALRTAFGVHDTSPLSWVSLSPPVHLAASRLLHHVCHILKL